MMSDVMNQSSEQHALFIYTPYNASSPNTNYIEVLLKNATMHLKVKTCQTEKGDVHCHTQTHLGNPPALVNHSDPYGHGEQVDY